MHPLTKYRQRQIPPITQAQFARELGVSAMTISRWERFRRQIDIDLVPKISAKTGIDPRELRPDLAEKLAIIA